METIKTKVIYDLIELMQLKIEQLKKYEAVLIFHSNFYLRY